MRDAERDLALVESIDNLGRFNIFATHALPYWIRRAKNLERALREMLDLYEELLFDFVGTGDDDEQVEVIGNIHDNPDLLGGNP